jgi:LPXTG-motif cell wall-anchored protein
MTGNQKTVLTFSAPVEMPGQILPAGTYVFKLVNSNSSRHIVQVANKEENHVFGTFLAIPSQRRKPSEETIIRFEERAAGSPQAIKAWFYPTKTYGHEFVYPKAEALALAQANNSPVPSAPAEVATNIKEPVTAQSPKMMALLVVPLKAEEPSGEEVDLAQAVAPSTQLPEELPKTGSAIPLLGLVGLLSLGTAAAMRFAGARVK